ncbi:type II toxin-antitoxin system prevent-host-death family antitoxin [Methylobacterium sp. NEAU 140]|uniref:type II toxin-antitoxin system Phd/YefM family antitoxin n=1 Tax=Methylobacterium sp. NEAU 140 TaxID=3064945 RepID=UPI002732FC5D|nr:type II toxin-antitoxin system prevent-host-death family antitoxin [Methylobacterium sp. NEAU 140]MDP4025689.1 type II toxin-antitoxin system prevent-host-death family antitoxin [Methylobacterium sp. NEAU 140]
MDEAVSVADADRDLSRLLRGAREGHSYVVTSEGRPIARIVPAGAPEGSRSDASTAGARASLFSRLARQTPVEIDRWTRDELYGSER